VKHDYMAVTMAATAMAKTITAAMAMAARRAGGKYSLIQKQYLCKKPHPL